MPESSVVHETVKRMLSSGIDDETIRLTLMDIGLTEDEAKNAIAGAKGVAPKPAAPAPKTPLPETEPAEAQSKAEPAPPVPTPPPKTEADEMAGAIGEDVIEEKPSAPAKPVASPPKPAQRTAPSATAPVEEQRLRETTSQVLAEEQNAAIGDVGKRVEELHERLPAAMMPNENLQKALVAQARDISELKASSSALQSLLKKILETDRKILLELSKKK